MQDDRGASPLPATTPGDTTHEADERPAAPSPGADEQRVSQEGAHPQRSLLQAGVFPPPDVELRHPRTAAPGDGQWLPWDAAVPALLVTTLHPHPTSRWQSLTIAAIDLARLQLRHELGTSDVKETRHASLAPEVGLVPAADQRDLVAVFNGGFQPRHGWWGVISHGVELVTPRDGGCALAIRAASDSAAGSSAPLSPPVRVGTWPFDESATDVWLSIRQTPPCLIENGALHPTLASGNERPWGGQQKDRKTRRRSAVALSADGRTLFYALGEEVGPRQLAAGLAWLEVDAAAQLDINWNWTRFWVFGQADAEEKPVEAIGSLVEQMARDRGEYVTRPSRRDFFYLLRRAARQPR